METQTVARPRKYRVSARDRLLDLLANGGYAVQEKGYGPLVFGSDGKVYSSRTVNILEGEGLAELVWCKVNGGSWEWAWVVKHSQ